MTNGEKFIEVFGDTTVLFDTDDNDTTIHQSGNWWDEEYKQSNSDEDCISRDQAIRIAEQGQLLGYEWQFKELCKLPSIQPKAKMGHWIYRVVGIYRYASCSECNKMQVDESNYCPNCGVRMEGETE